MFLVFPGSKHLLQTNQSILFLGKIFLILCHDFTSGYDGYRMVFTDIADIQAVRLFLRAREVIKCALQAASTSQNTECK